MQFASMEGIDSTVKVCLFGGEIGWMEVQLTWFQNFETINDKIINLGHNLKYTVYALGL